MSRLALMYLVLIVMSTLMLLNSVQLALSLTTSTDTLASTNIRAMNITIYYNVWENYGITTYVVDLVELDENYTAITLPLISNNASYIVAYDEYGKSLVFNYVEADGERWIEVFVSNTSRITITYGLEGVFEEVGVGTYIALVNLTCLSNYTFTLTLLIDGVFETMIEPSPSITRVTDGTTEIVFTTPDEYLVTLLTLFTPPETSYTTPTQTTPSTTAPQETPSPGRSAEVSSVVETRDEGRGGPIGLIVIGVLILIAIVVFIVVKRK